ncbi:MAG TPA: hypothetical protein VMB47_02150 [Candidatus Aquilonibacter sp.]|nr:hypothetical protein [Candidatus Aquilonibacter sp.]
MATHHFAAMMIFALLVAVALAALGERTPVNRARHTAWTFLIFVAFAVGFAWLLLPLSR